MPSYSYILPEYKTKNTTPSSRPSNPPLSQQTTVCQSKEPQIPYRDTGITGKSVYGQAPSWKYKSLPPLPFEKRENSLPQPPRSKFKELDCDYTCIQNNAGVKTEFGTDAKPGKIAKTWKKLSKKLTTTVLKS